jgi:hypothetical protein
MVLLRERTRPGLGIRDPCLQRGSKEAELPVTRFRQIALAQILLSGCAVMFGACVLIEHAQAQPGYVPPPTPLPPPVFNPSNPGTVPQPPYTPITPTTPGTTPSTPSTVPTGEATSPVSEEAPRSTARSEQGASAANTRAVHHHRGRFAGLGSYYCGYSPCVRIVVAEPPPVYRASVLWWPGFYDYADGQFGRGRPRYGGYPRRSGYHGD